MRLLISRGNFEQLTAGLSPIERDLFYEQVILYPDTVEPEWSVDQDRIGARYEQLHTDIPGLGRHSETEPPPAAYPPAKIDVGEGQVWIAPLFDGDCCEAGRAKPLFDYTAELEHPDVSGWGDLDDLVMETQPADETRRFFLNQWTPSEPPGPAVDQLRVLAAYQDVDRWRQTEALPRRELRAGENALVAFVAGYRPRPVRGYAKDPVAAARDLADLTGIPIRRDESLPPNVWKLVDPTTGTVLYEGTTGPTLDEYIQVFKEVVDQMAEETGLPRDLFYPD